LSIQAILCYDLGMNLDDATLEKLQEILTVMQPRCKAYEMIKAELKSRGRWKNLPRGKPPAPKYRYDKGTSPFSPQVSSRKS